MASYEEQSAKIERFDMRINELAEQERYAKKVKRLSCFLGIKTHTALSLLVETGDFARFAKGSIYAAFLGLAPGRIPADLKQTVWDYQRQETVICACC